MMGVAHVLRVALVASCVLCFGALEARAGFVIGGVVAALGLTGVAATVATTVIGGGLAFGLSYLTKASRPSSSQDTGFAGYRGSLEAGGTIPRSFIMGKFGTAGSLVYANTYGDSDKTPNQFLVYVMALSDLPVEKLSELWVNGKQASGTWAGNATGSGKGDAVAKFNKGGKDHLWIRFHDGTQTEVDGYLASKFGAVSGGRRYGPNRIGFGVAYVIITVRVNPKLWSGFPSFRFAVDGIPLYDLANDTSVGGSGTERWATPSTWSASPNNAAVMMYNIIRGVRFNGAWVWGGQSVQAAGLPFDNWLAARNWSNEQIDVQGGGTEKRWRLGAEISFDEEPLAVLTRMARCCNARLTECGGRFKIRMGGQDGASVLSIDDTSLVISENDLTDPVKGLNSAVNGVTADYISSEDGWVPKPAPPRIDAGYVADDGIKSIVQVSYDYIASKTQAQRAMEGALRAERQERSHDIHLPWSASFLEPVDNMDWTSADRGYASKLFRPDWIVIKPGLPAIRAGIVELDPDDYDWDISDELEDEAFPPLDYEIPDQGVEGFAVAGVTLASGAKSRPGIRATWTTADIDDVLALAYQVRRSSDDVIVLEGQTPAGEFDRGYHDISGGPIVGSTFYDTQVRYIPVGLNRETAWSGWRQTSTPVSRFIGDEVGDDEITSTHIPVDALTETYDDSKSGNSNAGNGYINGIDITIPFTQGKAFIFLSFDVSVPFGSSGAGSAVVELWRRRNGNDSKVDEWTHVNQPSDGVSGYITKRAGVPMVDIGPQSTSNVNRRYRMKLLGSNGSDISNILMVILVVKKV